MIGDPVVGSWWAAQRVGVANANSLHLASIHSSFGGSLSATDLIVLAAWGVGAAALAAWRFSWLPSGASA